jgi:hypothetical protein
MKTLLIACEVPRAGINKDYDREGSADALRAGGARLETARHTPKSALPHSSTPEGR